MVEQLNNSSTHEHNSKSEVVNRYKELWYSLTDIPIGSELWFTRKEIVTEPRNAVRMYLMRNGFKQGEVVNTEEELSGKRPDHTTVRHSGNVKPNKLYKQLVTQHGTELFMSDKDMLTLITSIRSYDMANGEAKLIERIRKYYTIKRNYLNKENTL